MDISNFTYSPDGPRTCAILFEPDFKKRELIYFYKRFLYLTSSLDFQELHIISAKHRVKFYSKFIINKSIKLHGGKLTHLEINNIMQKTKFSTIPEYKGAFELPPIESLSCGVPVLGFKSPSLKSALRFGQDQELQMKFFIDLYKYDLTAREIEESFNLTKKDREKFSSVIRHEFNADLIMEQFIKDLNGAIETRMKKSHQLLFLSKETT